MIAAMHYLLACARVMPYHLAEGLLVLAGGVALLTLLTRWTALCIKAAV